MIRTEVHHASDNKETRRKTTVDQVSSGVFLHKSKKVQPENTINYYQ